MSPYPLEYAESGEMRVPVDQMYAAQINRQRPYNPSNSDLLNALGHVFSGALLGRGGIGEPIRFPRKPLGMGLGDSLAKGAKYMRGQPQLEHAGPVGHAGMRQPIDPGVLERIVDWLKESSRLTRRDKPMPDYRGASTRSDTRLPSNTPSTSPQSKIDVYQMLMDSISDSVKN